MIGLADAGLSVGTLAGIVGCCVAVVALGVGGVEYRIGKLKRRLDLAERHALREAEQRAMLSLVTERGLAGTKNSLDFMAGVIQRVAENREDEIEIKDCIRLMSDLRADVERSWSEARLIAGQEATQISALQQLTKRLGDEGTTRLLKRGARAGSFGALEAQTLLTAAAQIEKRDGRD